MSLNMGFVNLQPSRRSINAAVLELILLCGVEENPVEEFAHAVLAHVPCPSWILLHTMVVRLCYRDFISIAGLE